MAILSQPAGDNRISIRNTLGRAFGFLGSHPFSTLGIAFLFSALPSQIYSMAIVDRMQLGAKDENLAEFGAYVITLITNIVVQAALMHAILAYSRNELPSFGRSLWIGLRNIWPLVGLLPLGVVAYTLILALIFDRLGNETGLLLFCMSSAVLLIMGSVAASALVAEGPGMMKAFRRSVMLIKGHRWKIFGLQFMMLLLIFLAITASNSIFARTMGQQMLTGDGIGATLCLVALTTLATAVWCAVQASLYVSLRNASQGPELESLAEVFA